MFMFFYQYTEDIRQNFEKTDISISSVTLLTPNIISQLESVSKQAGSVNFNSAIDQVAYCEFNITMWMCHFLLLSFLLSLLVTYMV